MNGNELAAHFVLGFYALMSIGAFALLVLAGRASKIPEQPPAPDIDLTQSSRRLAQTIDKLCKNNLAMWDSVKRASKMVHLRYFPKGEKMKELYMKVEGLWNTEPRMRMALPVTCPGCGKRAPQLSNYYWQDSALFNKDGSWHTVNSGHRVYFWQAGSTVLVTECCGVVVAFVAKGAFKAPDDARVILVALDEKKTKIPLPEDTIIRCLPPPKRNS